MNIINLIRYKNLILIALVQVLIKYAMFPAFNVDTTLSTFQFIILVISTVCIAAGGYIINDIFDVETDAINKPNKQIVGKTIAKDKAYNYYMAFTFIGVVTGFYLANDVNRSTFFGIFVVIAALLYIYASFLKPMLLVGNIVISGLVALSLIVVGIFDLLPTINMQNKFIQSSMFEVIVDYAVFAFLITFIREIVKDIQDIDGDYNAKMKTLPIVLGKSRAAKIAFGLTVASILILAYYLNAYLYMQTIAIIYFLIAVIAPLIYIAIKLFSAENKKDFKLISRLLKVVMLLGMLSMVVYYFII